MVRNLIVPLKLIFFVSGILVFDSLFIVAKALLIEKNSWSTFDVEAPHLEPKARNLIVSENLLLAFRGGHYGLSMAILDLDGKKISYMDDNSSE